MVQIHLETVLVNIKYKVIGYKNKLKIYKILKNQNQHPLKNQYQYKQKEVQHP